MPEPPGWMAERIADHVLAKPEPLVELTLDHERRTAEVVESNREQGGPCERDGEPSPRGTPRRSSGSRIEGAVLGHNRCPRRDVAQALAAAGNEDENTTKQIDRKSTRLNSSHRCISYAVFCL